MGTNLNLPSVFAVDGDDVEDDVWVRHEPSAGRTFIMFLVPRRSLIMAKKATKGYILIIDDEPTWRSFSETTLVDDGYGIETAGTLYEGIELLHGDCYDLVVVNAGLSQPQERDLLIGLVSRCQNTRLVIVSEPFISRTRALSEAQTAFKLGADEWINKPLGKRTLLETIETLIAGHSRHLPQD